MYEIDKNKFSVTLITMISKRYVGYFFVEYIFLALLADVYALKRSESSRDLLSRLLRPKNAKKPLVLIVDFENEPRARATQLDKVLSLDKRPIDYDYLGYDDERKDEEPGPYYSGTSSSSDSEDIAKEALRTALRCRQVDNCVRKCPPRKPSCPINCQQVFDSLNSCDPPTTTTRDPCGKKPRCGKTMPPKWRILLK